MYELFRLIRFHIIDIREIYTLAQLLTFYWQLTTEENSAKLRSFIDLKNKVKENFKQKLKFLKPAYFSLTSTSEFFMSSDDSVLSNCLSTVLLGCDKQKSLLIKNCAKAVSEEIQDRLSSQERQFPPNPRGEEYEQQLQQAIQSYYADC